MYTSILSRMKRRIIGIISGLIIGWLLIVLGEWVTSMSYSIPDEFATYTDAEKLAWIESLPEVVFWLHILSWTVAAFSGGFVASIISSDSWWRVSFITGFIMFLGALINFLMIPHPIWVVCLGLSVYLPMAYLGGHFAKQLRTKH